MTTELFIKTAALEDNAFEFTYDKNDIRIRITVPENYADYGMFIYIMKIPVERMEEGIDTIHYLSTLFKNLYFPTNPLDVKGYPEKEIIQKYKDKYPYEVVHYQGISRIKIS